MSEIKDPLLVRGKVTCNEIEFTQTNLTRSSLAQEASIVHHFNLLTARVHDDPVSLLPSSPGTNDDLGLFGTSFSTNTPFLETGDLGGQNGVTQFARFLLPIPPQYDDDALIRLHAAISSTNTADTSATVDVEAFKTDEEGGVDGSDLVTVSSKDFNSTSFADFDFTLDDSKLSVGDLLDVRVAATIDDGSGNTVKGKIGSVALVMDVKG